MQKEDAKLILMLLFIGIGICQSVGAQANQLDQNLITNEISKNGREVPPGPSRGDFSNQNEGLGNWTIEKPIEIHSNESSSQRSNATVSEDAKQINDDLTGNGQNNNDTQTTELDDTGSQGQKKKQNHDEMNKVDTGSAIDAGDAMDKVTEELQKAIYEVRQSKGVIGNNLQGAFNQLQAQLKKTASLLKTQLPIQKTLQTQLIHEGQLESFVKQSEKKYSATIANFVSNFINFNSGIIASLLRQRVTMYVETMLPTTKMLELQYLASQTQQGLDKAQEEYAREQDKFQSDQLAIVIGLNKEAVTKQEIVESLSQLSQNLKTHQQEEHGKLPTMLTSVRKIVDTSLSQINDNIKTLLTKLLADQQQLTKAMKEQSVTLKFVIEAGLQEIKKIYLRRATLNMQQLANQEIIQFERFRSFAALLNTSWNDLEDKAKSVSMDPSYDQHEDIALEVEDSMIALHRLPELLRAVKVRTSTQVLAYLTLSLVVFGLVSIVLAGALLLVKVIQAKAALRNSMKPPPKTEAQLGNYWTQGRRLQL